MTMSSEQPFAGVGELILSVQREIEAELLDTQTPSSVRTVLWLPSVVDRR